METEKSGKGRHAGTANANQNFEYAKDDVEVRHDLGK